MVPLHPLGSFFGSLSLNLLAGVLVVALAAGGTRLAQLLPSRRLWRLSRPHQVIICASQSTTSETGKYVRPATGVGQLRALATIAPSLSRAYGSLETANIVLAQTLPGSYHEADIISLGGSKTNPVTANVLQSLRRRGVPVPDSEQSQLFWPALSPRVFEAETIDGTVVKDYGLVVRARSPYHRRRTVVLLAGASTFGTAAAARHFVERCTFVRGDFAAIVCAEVRDAHVLTPSVVHFLRLPPGSDFE
jgi:hypothetical protein